jgi:hypothetical protein
MRYLFLFIVALFLIATSAAEAQAAPNAGVKVITVVDNGNNGRPKSASDFQFTLAQSGQLPLFSFAGSAQTITVPLTVSGPTTFVLSRISAPTGYVTTFSGDCNPDGMIVVARGEVKSCIITHSYISVSESGPSIAVLKIIKQMDVNGEIVSAAQPADFTIRVLKNSDQLIAAVPGSVVGINVGLAQVSFDYNLYKVREDPYSPFYFPTYGGDCNSAGLVILRPDRTATCVVTNSYLNDRESGSPTAVLKIIKRVDGVNEFGHTAQPEQFQIDVLKSGNPVASVQGSEQGLIVGLAAGGSATSYRVRERAEDVPGAYFTTYSGDCSATGDVSLQAGQRKTCVVTNAFINDSESGSSTALLKIVKRVDANIPFGAVKQPEEFLIEVLRGRVDPGESGDQVATVHGSTTGLNVGLAPAGLAYTVREIPDGSRYFSTYSGDCSAGGVVSIFAGQTKTCVVTNSYLNESEHAPVTAVLKVIKRVDTTDVNDPPQAGEFQISVSKSGSPITSVYGSQAGFNIGLGAADTGTNYTVQEDPRGQVNGYLPTYSGDCTGSGIVNLKAGETKTCVVTNSLLDEVEGSSPTAVVNIRKHVEANDFEGTPPLARDFVISLIRDSQTLKTISGSEMGTNVGVLDQSSASGLLTIVETLSNQQPSFLPSYSGDCSSNSGTIVVHTGEKKNCTVTNTYVGGSNLNRPPVAFGQTASLNEDTSKPITLVATDPEGNPISYILDTLPSHGTLSGNAPNLTYTPTENYNGSDSFTYHASQGNLLSNTATVSLTVLPVNDAPVANNTSAQPIAETELVIPLPASDVDSGQLTAQIVQAPTHGTLTLSGLNATYTPANDYLGSDSFRYAVSDGVASSNTATVGLIVKNGIVISDVTLIESNSTAVPAAFVVRLLAPSSQTTTVQYTTANGNAIAGLDYAAKSGTITFAPGQTSVSVVINVYGEQLFEPTEVFLLLLTNPTNAVLKDGVAVGTILNDDPQVGVSEMNPSAASAEVAERVNLVLRWTHPERWRLLDTIDFRIIDDQGSVMWVRFSEPANTFSLFNPISGTYGSPVIPGSPQPFETNAATMYVEDSRVQGSGPTGPSVVLTYSLSFKALAAGRVFRVEAFATDDFGNQQGFDVVGTVSIRP